MRWVVQLIKEWEQAKKVEEKIDFLIQFFEKSSHEDALWLIALGLGRKPKRLITSTILKEWVLEKIQMKEWLFEESYKVVGDLVETISLVLPIGKQSEETSLSYWMDQISSHCKKELQIRKEFVEKALEDLGQTESYVFCKLITGSNPIKISSKIIVKSLSKFTGKEEYIIQQRLAHAWPPEITDFKELFIKENQKDDLSKPYPFKSSEPIEQNPEELGHVQDFIIEWKWAGIRAQIIKRENELFIWSKELELLTDKFPELLFLKDIESGNFVIDGEIIAFKDQTPKRVELLEKRLTRKNVSRKLLEEIPVTFVVFDIMEYKSQDIRKKSTRERKANLNDFFEKHLADTPILLSEILGCKAWEEAIMAKKNSQKIKATGLILKASDSIYLSNNPKENWISWKADPLFIDAVLLYATRSNEINASMYSEYTFAVWKANELIPIAKGKPEISETEEKEINQFINNNTIKRFGPVRSVRPKLVFQLAIENIYESKRHKSGLTIKEPQILHWQKDKKAKEANCLDDLFHYLKQN